MTSATASDSMWRKLYYTRFRDALRGRFDARLDWRQLVASANLPTELATAVERVVSKSGLWRAEKEAVATEMVSHFQDGLDAGVPADVLLQSFGDPTAAAQLIRRAKRRNRSAIWHIWHYGWMTWLALTVVYIAIGLWMSLGRPTVRIDYLADANKVALAVPQAERAWPEYRDALLAMGFSQREGEGPAAKFLANTSKPEDKAWAEKEKFLTDNAASVAKLRDAAGRSGLGFASSTSRSDFSEKDRELFGMQLKPEEIEADKYKTLEDRWAISAYVPQMIHLRDTGMLLGADARRAAIAGDGATAYADVVAMFGVSKHSEEIPFMVCALVANAVQREATAVIHDVLTDHAGVWSDAQLRDLAHKVAASRIDWQRGFEGETIAFNDSMQRLYTDNGNGDGRLAYKVTDRMNLFQMLDSVIGTLTERNPAESAFANPALAILSMPAANALVASRKDMVEMYEKLTNHVRVQVEKPLWQQDKNDTVDSELIALKNDRINKFRYLFIDLLLPAYDKLHNNVVVSDGARDGVFLGLALELYHRQHKKWPGSLAELSPQYLPQVPVDRITGKPLHYNIVDDRPFVYSVGPDSDDDGGRAVEGELQTFERDPNAKPADGDWIIWPTNPSS
jgi:hypothetical protein